MQKGTVKFYNKDKGFGFIVPQVGGKDIFVHATGINEGEGLSEGDQVVYDTEDGKKGVNAVNVQLA